MKKIQIIVLSFLISVACFGIVSAWIGPSNDPPNSNVSAPLNIGSTFQLKAGSLQSATDMRAPKYFDYPSTDYYVDPDETSNLNLLYANYTGVSIYYDKEDTTLTYRVDPNDASVLDSVTARVFIYNSDRRLKKEIKVVDNALEKVLQLEGVSFKWIDKEKGEKINLGVIAQDVEKVFPEVVHTDPKTGLKSVEYGNLISPVIEAVKEQQKYIDSLELRIKELENKIN